MPMIGWRFAAIVILALQLYQFHHAVDPVNWQSLMVKLPVVGIFLFSAIGLNLYAFDMTLGGKRVWITTKYLLFVSTVLVILSGLVSSSRSSGSNITIVLILFLIALINGVALNRLARRTEMRRI